MRRSLTALYQRAGIGFILQNTDNGGSGPFAVLPVRVAALGVRKSVVPLIRQRREDAQAVEFFRNMKGAESVQTLSENIPHHIGGIGIDLQALVLFSGLEVSIYRERTDKIAAAPFGFQGASCLYRYVAAVCLVHNVLDRDRQIVRRVIHGIYIVIDRDKADAISRENPAHVAACLDILTAKTGEILHDYAVCFALLDHVHHFLKRRTVEQDAAVSVVDFLGNDLDLRVLLHEVIDQASLVGYAVAFHGLVVRIGQAYVLDSFVKLHIKTLLSLQKNPAIQGVWFAVFNSFSDIYYTSEKRKSQPLFGNFLFSE